MLLSCNKKQQSLQPIEHYFKLGNEDDFPMFIYYSQISKEDRDRIWTSLSDTTKPIIHAVKIVKKIKALPKKFQRSLHLTFLDVCAVKEWETYNNRNKVQIEDSSHFNLSDYVRQKIVDEMQELYDEEIIYDCVIPRTFSSRYIFLDNNEVHIMNGLWFASQDVQHWKVQNDTIVFHPNDSITAHLVHDIYNGRSYLRSTANDGYSMKFLRSPKNLPPKKKRP